MKIVITDHTDDTPAPTTDNDLDDIDDAGATVATSGNLTAKGSTGGTASAANVTFGSVTGDAADSISGYFDTGTPATSLLIFYMDQATGLPVTPNGGDITVAWNGSGIFTL
jgi:hypothetical protein